MKKISLWAKNHKWLSRVMIVLSTAALSATGIIVGTLLNDLNVMIPLSVFVIPVILYFSGFIYYPRKSEKTRSASARFYRTQKTSDVILIASAFCMVLLMSNYHLSGAKIFPALFAATPVNPVLPEDSTVKTYKSLTVFTGSLKDENGKSLKWKEKKKLLKEQINGIKKAGDLSEEGKIALIILSVLVALGLIFVVAAAACSLSCGGSGGAAVLVAIGGTALVVLLLTVVLKGITGKKKNKEKPHLSN